VGRRGWIGQFGIRRIQPVRHHLTIGYGPDAIALLKLAAGSRAEVDAAVKHAVQAQRIEASVRTRERLEPGLGIG
jgi:hypothetical protein